MESFSRVSNSVVSSELALLLVDWQPQFIGINNFPFPPSWEILFFEWRLLLVYSAATRELNDQFGAKEAVLWLLDSIWHSSFRSLSPNQSSLMLSSSLIDIS